MWIPKADPAYKQNIAPCIVTQLYFMSMREAEYAFHHCKLHFCNGIACYNFFFLILFFAVSYVSCDITMQTANTTISVLQEMEAMVFTSITLQQDQAELGNHLHKIHHSYIARNDLALYSYNKGKD